MKKPSNFPKFTNTTTNDAALVNSALNIIWQYMQSGSAYTLPIASPTVLGGIKPDGSTITVDPITGIATAEGGGGGGSTFINGSNNTLDFFSPDAGASVRLRQLVGGVMIDSGWEVDVQTVTPPVGAYKIVAMYVDHDTLMPVVVYDDGGGGVPTIPSNALQIRNIYVDASTLAFTVVYMGADMALHTITLSSFTTPTGTGFAHITAGVLDGAAQPSTPQVSPNFLFNDNNDGTMTLQKNSIQGGGGSWVNTDTMFP